MIEQIKSLTEFPYIEEDNMVLDGSFALAPYATKGLRGDGCIRSSTDYYACNLFMKDKGQLVKKAKRVWKQLQSQKGYTCDDPDYTYEKEGKIWRAALHIQVLREDEK